MTEKLTEPGTEQGWLGNEKPEAYLHNGHRITPPKLTPPLVSLSRPFESAGAMVLVRNLVNAEADFMDKKDRAIGAEVALQEALAAEEEASNKAAAAMDALVMFARGASDQ